MKLKENEHIELKKSVSEIKEALKSISAMLNKHKKGTIYFNIAPSGKPVKNDVSVKTLRKISQSISDRIEPKIYPQITVEKIESINVIKIKFEGQQTPYSADGRYYIRVGDEDKQMSQEQLKQFILKNKDLRWDAIASAEFSIKDVDANKVKGFCKLASIKYSNVRDVLQNVNLIRNNELLNAAIVLFGKMPSKFFPNVKLMCSVFGTNNTAVIIDQKEFAGDIFYLIETALKYILQNIHIGMEVAGLYRKDVPEINREALREAVINAFLHRDYFDPDFVSVFIFKDRVEIRNPGRLFGGITIEDILTKNISRRRNEVIADILSRAHYGERKGHGIALIKEAEPEANFEQVGDVFISSFKRNKYLIPQEVEVLTGGLKDVFYYVSNYPGANVKKIANALLRSPKTVGNWVIKLKKMNLIEFRGSKKKGGYYPLIPHERNLIPQDRVVLTGDLKELLSLIRNNPGSNIKQIAKMISKPYKTVEKWIGKLKEFDLIEFKGSKKFGGYFIK